VYPLDDIVTDVMRKRMQQVVQQAFVESGLSIKKLSEITRLPYSVAHGAVTGSTDPQLSTVERICKVLELELRPASKAAKGE